MEKPFCFILVFIAFLFVLTFMSLFIYWERKTWSLSNRGVGRIEKKLGKGKNMICNLFYEEILLNKSQR